MSTPIGYPAVGPNFPEVPKLKEPFTPEQKKWLEGLFAAIPTQGIEFQEVYVWYPCDTIDFLEKNIKDNCQ